MTAHGLDNRLRQHSRRAGLMVGISMALTIGLCIGSFVWIYAKFDPLTRDFVDVETPAPTREVAASNSSGSGDDGNISNDGSSEVIDNNSEATRTPLPTATSAAFAPTHQVIAVSAVNMRPGPAVSSGEEVTTVDANEQIQYLNESKPSEDEGADPGQNWLKFRTQNGDEGWIREDFVEPLNPGQ